MTIGPQLLNGASFSLQTTNDKSSIVTSLYETFPSSAKAYQDLPMIPQKGFILQNTQRTNTTPL